MKKKIALLLSLLCLSILLTACTTSEPDVPTGFSSETDAASSTTAELPKYTPGSVRLEPQESDDYDFERKYRKAYYMIWGYFSESLTEEEAQDFNRWSQEENERTHFGETRNEMLLVSFIKRYDISRTEFDQAVERMKAAIVPDEDGIIYEETEIPNGDIIYTFDNEIINHYYRYE